MITQQLTKLLYMDIETAPIVQDFYSLPDRLADIYHRKNEKEIDAMGSVQAHWDRYAGLEAEYAKVCCISFGTFSDETNDKGEKVPVFRVKSLYGDDEVKILKDFAEVLDKAKGYNLSGHNIAGFDVPFLAKRYLINALPVPRKLNKIGEKPWDNLDVDSMLIWRGGNFSNKLTSLELLTAVLDIESPKGDMDGASVREAFYKGEFERIAKYCQKDVISVARVCQRLNLETPIADSNIRIV